VIMKKRVSVNECRAILGHLRTRFYFRICVTWKKALCPGWSFVGWGLPFAARPSTLTTVRRADFLSPCSVELLSSTTTRGHSGH
jgi:hypothetical protein